MECVNQQTTLPEWIVIVDSGSRDPSYLQPYQAQSNVTVVLADKDIGFCKGNNIGMSKIPRHCDYVFLLNPDAFLTPRFVEEAMAFMEDPANRQCGALTGTVLGYDVEAGAAKGAYDSTGVFRSWYGRWYDRDQGSSYQSGRYRQPEVIPAICGAVFFCRKKALESVLIREREILDNTFYMYKEDIDLSIRLQRKGWSLCFVPSLIAYHCRGWQRDRSKMPRELKIASARNELRIQKYQKAPIPFLYSLCKFAAVKIFNI